MEIDDGGVRVLDGNSWKRDCLKRSLLFLGLFLIVFLLVLVLWFTLLGGSSFPGCASEKGFNVTRYTLPNGHFQELGFLFVEKEPGVWFYNFQEGKDKCTELGAQTWELLGGEAEWNLMFNIAKNKGYLESKNSGIWMNALLLQKCPDIPSKACVEEKAQKGEGLTVKWPSTGEEASYSRLAGRDDSLEEKCVAVNSNGLWSTTSCLYKMWTLCILRTC